MNGVLLFHNILWSHYKGRVFSELSQLCGERSIKFSVVQYATTERRRMTIGPVDLEMHQYPYRVLYEGPYDDMPLFTKIRLSLAELHRKDPEIIVLPGYWDPSFWVLVALARLEGRKVILTCDSTELDHPRKWIKEFAKRLFVSICDGGFAYGQRSKKYLHRLGMSDHRITVRCQAAANREIETISNSAKTKRPQLIQELGLAQKNFCYVGRLSPEKNVSCLIHAYLELKRTNRQACDWGLLIIGDGPERDYLESFCQRERLDQVKFFGGVSWRDVPRILAAADVVVLPSLSEPWGLVVNESMICGLPVIVSNRCGCVEDLVVSGETGFTFNPESHEELHKLIEHFVLVPGDAGRIGENARRLISAYTPETAAKQMLAGIEQFLKAA